MPGSMQMSPPGTAGSIGSMGAIMSPGSPGSRGGLSHGSLGTPLSGSRVSFPAIGKSPSRGSVGGGSFLPEPVLLSTVTPVTATQLLRARLRGETDSLRSMLQGGELDVRDAALRAFSVDGTRCRGRYTGRVLCPAPVCKQDYLLHNTALTRWSGSECVPHGSGIFEYPSRDIFEGEWRGGWRADGFGVMRWADGGQYEGEWKQDRRHGSGKMRYANGDVFEGLWHNDSRVDGEGRMLYSNGDVYQGQFKNDMRHGEGTIVYSGAGLAVTQNQGDRFVGQWAFDRRADGFGTMYFADGGVYEGEWVAELRHGMGKMTYGSSAAQPHTRGRGPPLYSWDNDESTPLHPPIVGDCFEGEWTSDERKDGHGKMSFADGRLYEGGWQAGKAHGIGRLMSLGDGTTEVSVFEGTFEAGKKMGEGRAVYTLPEKDPAQGVTAVECVGQWSDKGMGTGKCALPEASEALMATAVIPTEGQLTCRLDYSAGVPQFRSAFVALDSPVDEEPGGYTVEVDYE
jgi:hypothetical protein